MIDRQNYIFSLLEIPLKPRFFSNTGNNESHPSNHLSNICYSSVTFVPQVLPAVRPTGVFFGTKIFNKVQREFILLCLVAAKSRAVLFSSSIILCSKTMSGKKKRYSFASVIISNYIELLQQAGDVLHL